MFEPTVCPVESIRFYLAFLGDIDGEEETFLQDLVRRASEGLRALFSCCEGFSAASDLPEWMRQHRSPSIANYRKLSRTHRAPDSRRGGTAGGDR